MPENTNKWLEVSATPRSIKNINEKYAPFRKNDRRSVDSNKSSKKYDGTLNLSKLKFIRERNLGG
jgi:hypothetical protein